jgi:hypothetical protein
MKLIELPPAELPEGTVTPETVNLKREQLEGLIQTLNDYKVKIFHFENDIASVGLVLKKVLPLFEGKTSVFALLPVITQLISDPSHLENFKKLLPILEKYQHKTPNNNEEK